MTTDFTRFVALDVETTGLEKDARIIEIGLVSVNDGKIVDQWRSFVRPPQSIPREITRLTGITNEMVANAPSWNEIEDEVLNRIEGRLLIAHNVAFDRARLDFECSQQITNDWLDTHDLAKLFLPHLSSYKLAAIAAHLNIRDNDHHRALNDAMVCAAVAVRLLSIGRHFDPLTLLDMATLFAGADSAYHRLLTSLAQNTDDNISRETSDSNEENFFSEINQTPKLNFQHLTDFFSADGILADNHQYYEARPQQSLMAETISRAFLNERHAIIEAGTGTGKSFAYLLPALLWGYENSCRVVISTATIALQEQLFQSDIPFLSRILGYPFRATICKGRSNYLCKRRFYAIFRHPSGLNWNERLFYAALLLWQKLDKNGDREHLNLNKMENQFWQNIAATNDTCMGRRCGHYNDCYFFTNRRQAEKSQLIIVNHSLLLQDAKLDGGVLPDYKEIIIDEAHHLEDEASRQFTEELDMELVRKNIYTLTRTSGLLSRILNRAAESTELTYDYVDIEEIIATTRLDAADLNTRLNDFISFACALPELDKVSERRITEKVRQSPWWIDLMQSLTGLLNDLRQLKHDLERLLKRLGSGDDIEDLARELHFACAQLAQDCLLAEAILSGQDEEYVYWAKSHRAGWGNNIMFFAARIDIMPILYDSLFANRNSVVLTSATLAVGNNLTYPAERFLLQEGAYEALICQSPFSHQEQSMIAIPTDHPDYSKISELTYSQHLIQDLTALIPAVKGDMLVLFTSYAMLNRVYDALKAKPELTDYTILGHGKDGNRSSIITQMRRHRHTVVLGAASFWEGIDVPGSHLRTVVIAKLPFAPPTAPLESARSERLQAAGKSAFNYRSLPDAILRFRQGCGRLLRSRRDHGAVIILDNRVITKSYGKRFLQSLPKQPIVQADMTTLCLELNDFMQSHESN